MKIKKESKLYKLVYKMSTTFPFEMYIHKDKWKDDVPSSFNDVCTFIRHLLITLLIVFPLALIVFAVSIYTILFTFIYTPYQSLVGNNEAGYFIIGSSLFVFLSYVILLIIQSTLKNEKNIFNKAEDDNIEDTKNGLLTQILNVVKEKNSKICKKIDVE